MLTSISHAATQWRKLCTLLGVDPDVATVEAIVVNVRGKPVADAVPVQAHIAGAPIFLGDKPVVTTTTDALPAGAYCPRCLRPVTVTAACDCHAHA